MTGAQPDPVFEPPLMPAATLAVWVTVLGVGLAGLIWHYPRPRANPPKEFTVAAEAIKVELTRDPLPQPLAQAAAPGEPPPPAPLEPLSVSEAPALTPVADPAVAAFALPVTAPVQLVAPRQAAFSKPAPATEQVAQAQGPAAARQLVFGQGEGKQPAPEYPYRARREGQEGVVNVRFAVGENGSVFSAEAASPCPWQLLNDAAVRVVRERWKFRPGPARLYEVSIRFQITR